MANLTAVRQVPSETLKKATEYIRRGWALIPFSPTNKNPLFDLLPPSEDGQGVSWKPLAKNKATVEVVQRWLEAWPNMNLGIICGQARGIVIIDTDKPLRWPMEYLTPTVKTRRGYHYYLKTDRPYKSVVIKSKTGEAYGELRAEGNVTIIPPSTHVETGQPYEWVDGLGIDDVPMQPITKNLIKAFVKLNPHLEEITLEEDRKRIEARKNILPCFNEPRPYNSEQDAVVRSSIPYMEYLQDPRVVISIMQEMGCDVKALGQAFSCPIHGPDEHPSAALYVPHDEGFISMMDFHNRKLVPIPDLYAAHVKGKYEPLGTGERALWWIRCLVDHGYIDYPRILARPLPEEAPEAAKELYKGFVMLLGIRKLYNADQTATPFSWRFAAGWCGGLTNYKIKQGMAWLLKHGFIHKTGTTSSRTALFALQPAEETSAVATTEAVATIPDFPIQHQDGQATEIVAMANGSAEVWEEAQRTEESGADPHIYTGTTSNRTVEEATDVLPSSAIKMSIPDEAIFFFHDIEEVEELYKQHQVMRL